MQFKNSTHKRRFMSAIKPMDQKDKTQMAVAFLLTATKALWDRSRICMINNKILVHRIHLNHTSEEVYVLYCAAKDIVFGTTHISVGDLVDEELVSRELYFDIENPCVIEGSGIYSAMAVNHFGKTKEFKFVVSMNAPTITATKNAEKKTLDIAVEEDRKSVV